MRLVDHVRISRRQKSRIPARVSAETGEIQLRNGGGSVAFQSSLERGFVQICDFANEVRHIAWEPFTIEFDDRVDGKVRTYTPDYLVDVETRNSDRHRYIVGVKQKQEADRIWAGGPTTVQARAHVAMMAWCRDQQDCSFLLVTEHELAKKGLGNIRAIVDRASYEPDEALAEHLLSSVGRYGPIELGQVSEMCGEAGFARPEVLSTALRLCADDRIWFDVASPWNDRTLLNQGPRRRVFIR